MNTLGNLDAAPRLEAWTRQLTSMSEVTRSLGCRSELEVPRLPGIVAWARSLGAAAGLLVTVDVHDDGVLVRFTPSPARLTGDTPQRDRQAETGPVIVVSAMDRRGR